MEYIDIAFGVTYVVLIAALQYVKLFMTEKELQFWAPILRQLILVMAGFRVQVGANGNVTFTQGTAYVSHDTVKGRTGKLILAIQSIATALAGGGAYVTG